MPNAAHLRDVFGTCDFLVDQALLRLEKNGDVRFSVAECLFKFCL